MADNAEVINAAPKDQEKTVSRLDQYPEDCAHIQTLARELGYNITLDRACDIWVHHSDTFAAGWLCLGDDDEVKYFIQPYLTGEIKDV